MQEISTATWWLLITTMSTTAIAAVGVYEAFFVMPKWFADVPKSLQLMRSRTTIRFWIPLQIVSLISFIGTCITNWDNMAIHMTLIVSISSYVLIWITTATYFVPGVIRFSKVAIDKPAPAGLAANGKRWLGFSWLRQIAMVVSAFALLIALAQT